MGRVKRSWSGNEGEENNGASDDNPESKTEVLLKLLGGACKELGQRIKRTLCFILNEVEDNQIINRFVQWCIQHPQMAICLLSAGLVVALPIFLFVAFALSTIVLTFTGFLVLEGTLLTIISMIMLGLLGTLGIVLIFFAVIGLVTYVGVSHVYNMYGNTEDIRTL